MRTRVTARRAEFMEDVERFPRRGGAARIVSFITEPAAVGLILATSSAAASTRGSVRGQVLQWPRGEGRAA